MHKKAVYAGTFDPITLGHLNIIERASHLFDEVIVGVATSARKAPLFSLVQRKQMIELAVASIRNVRVAVIPELTVHFAEQCGAHYLVRGVRSFQDYEYETHMAGMNRCLCNTIETVLLLTQSEYAHVSSSMVRELFSLNAFEALKGCIPSAALDFLRSDIVRSKPWT